MREQTKALETGTKAFTDAVRAGDTEKAKSLYAQVRIPWERIEPVAELFPDSDGVIDSRADDFEKKEADPEFTGFHAIEYGLWAQRHHRRGQGRSRSRSPIASTRTSPN